MDILSGAKDLRQDTKRLLELGDKLPSEETLTALLGKIDTIERVVDKLLVILNKLDKKQLSSLIRTLDKLPDDGTITSMLQFLPQVLPLLQNLPDPKMLRELLDKLNDVEKIAAALTSEE